MTITLTAVPYPSTSVVRVNLIRNPRPSGGTAPWAHFAGTGGAAALTIVPHTLPIVGRDGVVLPATDRLVMTQTTAATGVGGLFYTTPPGSITAGLPYTASIYCATAPSRDMSATIGWYTAAGALISQTTGPAVACGSAASGYARVAVTSTPPAGTSYATVTFYTTTPLLAGATLVFVCALLESGGLQDYFDGSTRAPVGARDAWTAVPHLSEATRTTRTVAGPGAWQSRPALVLDYQAERESRSVAHTVIGRQDQPHTLGPLAARTGRLTAFYLDHPAAQAAVELHTAPRVMLRDTEHPGLSMYYVPRTVRLVSDVPSPQQRWRVEVDYVEAYPSGDLW